MKKIKIFANQNIFEIQIVKNNIVKSKAKEDT